MFYLTMHLTYFIYGYMTLAIIIMVKEFSERLEICFRHYMGYTFRLAAEDGLNIYVPSHKQDSTYHGVDVPVVEHWLEREIAEWVHHEGSIQRPIAP